MTGNGHRQLAGFLHKADKGRHYSGLSRVVLEEAGVAWCCAWWVSGRSTYLIFAGGAHRSADACLAEMLLRLWAAGFKQ